MKKLFLSLLLIVLFASGADAQEAELTLDRADIMPPMMESHSYTYIVDEDGTARAWVRLDGIKTDTKSQSYVYSLPEGTTGEPLAWYRENGCLEYRADNCVYYGSTTWKTVEFTREGDRLTLTIPASRYPGRFNENTLNLGIMFATGDVTDKSWWGRSVAIQTGSADQFVSYLNVGVYMPDGVYVRDYTQGPSGWGAGISEALSSAQNRPTGIGDVKMAQAAMLDSAGGGQIYRYRQNMMPGESYAFDFMSSTSLWQLFYPEIGFALGWLTAIGAVIAALLRLIIGKKPLSWYAALVGLLVLLGVLVGGLWFTYHTAFGRSGVGIMPMYKGGFGGGGSAEPAVDMMMAEPASAPAEITTMETEEVLPSTNGSEDSDTSQRTQL